MIKIIAMMIMIAGLSFAVSSPLATTNYVQKQVSTLRTDINTVQTNLEAQVETVRTNLETQVSTLRTDVETNKVTRWQDGNSSIYWTASKGIDQTAWTTTPTSYWQSVEIETLGYLNFPVYENAVYPWVVIGWNEEDNTWQLMYSDESTYTDYTGNVSPDATSFILYGGGNELHVNYINTNLVTSVVYPQVTQTEKNAWNNIVTGTAGETLTAGNICYLKSDGKFWKAIATAEATTAGLIAIATSSASADGTCTMMLKGIVTDTLTAGSTYYVATTTAGAKTLTRPSTSGQFVRVLGYAISSTQFYFNPDSTYLEIK